MIPSEVIDKVINEDIVKIIQDEGITLIKQGADYVCCCPFHNEKTPSFHVSSTRNRWHCFGKCGEDGNAIDFIQKYRGMKFTEAVEYIAKTRKIDYEVQEESIEIREARFRREKLLNVVKEAWHYFRANINAPAAQEYVKKRKWSEETINNYGIGFAPRTSHGLVDFLKAKGIAEADMKEAGVISINEEKGYAYDYFRGRIIFPIKSQSGQLVAFTGRDVTGDCEEDKKYLFSRNTTLAQKGDYFFGLDQATRSIHTSSEVILVEGNPDAIRLHQIGQRGAIAMMTKSLSEKQLAIIQRIAKRVLIISDVDEAGIQGTKDSGKELLARGISVRVMILPKESEKRKVDADEYFSIRPNEFDKCLAEHTYDYIPWITDTIMEGKVSQTEQAAAITEVCALLATVSDQNAVDIYLSDFTKKYKNGSVWKKCYIRSKNSHDRRKEKDEKAEDMISEYGLYIKNNCYYGVGTNAGDRRWSNFILEPILHIRDEKNARRIFLIKNNKATEAVIKFTQQELVSFTDFKTRVETAGNFIWEATANELTMLKKYLYEDTPSADEITQLGWQKRSNFFAWGNGGMEDGKFFPANKYGIVTIGDKQYYIPGCGADTKNNLTGYQHQRRFVYGKTNDITLREYANQMITVFGDNAKVALCFLVATMFRDIVTGITTSFPILNLFGPKGTGKSELGHALTAFFITSNIAPNINNTTKAALAEAVAEVSNAIVHLDEYKNNLDMEKREFLKGLWDGTGRSRMNMDNDKKRETTAVDCGVVISGQEMPTADIALFNRMIFLQFSKSEFSDKEKAEFEALKIEEKRGLTHLAGEILQCRRFFMGNFRNAWDTAIRDLNDNTEKNGIEDRTLRNWATVLAAFKTVEGKLDLPFCYGEMLKICTKGCIEQNSKTKESNELSGFWNCMDALVTQGQIQMDVHYKVKMGMKEVRLSSLDKTELNPTRPYLLLNFGSLSGFYLRYAKETGEKFIPKDSLKYYLEHSVEYQGTAKSERFLQIEGIGGYISRDSSMRKYKVTSAMMFDYEQIKKHYNIDLVIETGQQTLVESAAPSPTMADIPYSSQTETEIDIFGN